MIERYGYLPDTGGPGKLRGGLALERQYRFLEAEGVLQLRTDRRSHAPYGLAGGRPGTPSGIVLNPGTEERQLPAKCTLTVRSGDVYRHELGGAGVAIDERTWKIVPEETARLRAAAVGPQKRAH